MKKKILLSILCICMVLTMMPTLAFAEDAAAPSTKGATPEFENEKIYVKTREQSEITVKVTNSKEFNQEGEWKVYGYEGAKIKENVTATYNATDGVLTLSGSNIIYDNYITYTPVGGQESTKSLCFVGFQKAAMKPCMKNYIIDWGQSIPWKIEISENSQTFDKVIYQVGNPGAEKKVAKQDTDYKVTRDPKTNIATFEFANEFMKTQLGNAEKQDIFFNFKYTGGPEEGAIQPNIKLIDKVKESTTDPNESKWKKGSADSLSFQVNDDCYYEKGSFIEGKSMVVNNKVVINGITRSIKTGPQSYITVKLAPEYLNTLDCGWHRMEFFFGETEAREQGPLSLRLLSDGKAVSSVELVLIGKYLRHVIGDFLIYDDTHTIENLPPSPPVYVAPKREPITPDPVPTDPSTNPPVVYPPVVTPVVPDTSVVPVPPVVEPVDPVKPETPVDPAKPETTVDGDETSTTNFKTDNQNNKSNSPQTGDNTNPWTWMILFGMSGIGLGSILINKKRNTNR